MNPEQLNSDNKKPKREQGKADHAPISRSENMSRIRGKNTQPELKVRRALWAAGLRYRLYDKSLPGNPDLVFPGRRTVIFVHGCFWHCHEGCNKFRIPKTRTNWWTKKLNRNKARDAEVAAALEAEGWRVIVVWECEVDDTVSLSNLADHLKSAPNRS